VLARDPSRVIERIVEHSRFLSEYEVSSRVADLRLEAPNLSRAWASIFADLPDGSFKRRLSWGQLVHLEQTDDWAKTLSDFVQDLELQASLDMPALQKSTHCAQSTFALIASWIATRTTDRLPEGILKELVTPEVVLGVAHRLSFSLSARNFLFLPDCYVTARQTLFDQ